MNRKRGYIWFNDPDNLKADYVGYPPHSIAWIKTFQDLNSQEAQDFVADCLAFYLKDHSLGMRLRLMNPSNFEQRVRKIS